MNLASADTIRCILLSEMLQPYRIPVFNRLASHPRLDFEVFLLSLKEANRQWEIDLDRVRFRYRILPHFDLYIRSLDYGFHLNRGVRAALSEFAPDVIVGTGYTSPTYWRAQSYARKHGAGYVLWSGSTQNSSRIGAFPIRKMKERFVKRCHAFLAYGSAAARYLTALGADTEKVVRSVNTVDVEWFAAEVDRIRKHPEIQEWKQQFRKHNILFVGQMIPRKGVPELVEAFRRVETEDLGLIFVGTGPLWEAYRNRFADIPGLFWEGYKQSQELVRYYAIADVVVMPSSLEVWGLVVNEAMASGVPVIATTCSGATEDLIREGENGYSYESGDVDRLSALLKDVRQCPEKWKKMGEKASDWIRRFGPDKYADDFVKAVELARSTVREGNR